MLVIANWNIATRDDEGNLRQYKAGDLIEDITEGDAKHLLNTGAARLPEGKNKPLNELPPETEVDEDILKDFKESFEYDELKTEAANAGLSFAGNISYKNLVKLIIESGKVDEFFEEEE